MSGIETGKYRCLTKDKRLRCCVLSPKFAFGNFFYPQNVSRKAVIG